MSVALRRQRDGKLRPYWYGEHIENGKRRVLNLGEWRGTPPPSLLGTGTRSTGDAEFEASRTEAEKALKAHADDAGRKGRVEHLTERLIESKTGTAPEYVRLDEMATRWRNMGRDNEASERYFKSCDAHFERFNIFMRTRNPAAVFLYNVTKEDAAAFKNECRAKLAPATAMYAVRLINKTMSRCLPTGAENPFGNFVSKAKNNERGVIHRKPFTVAELQSLFDTARNDAFMYPLIVTAAQTGMRRGDVCALKWEAVDFKKKRLHVKTHKTDSEVVVPIWPLLQSVLEAQPSRQGFVFPKAARMLAQNPNGLTWRFKQIVTRALNDKPRALPPPVADVAEVKNEALAAIETMPESERRDRIRETFCQYCAGVSVRGIEKNTGVSRSTISADLHAVESLIKKSFIRNGQANDIKPDIARITREPREKGKGKRAASVRDWHALRVTWVTLALSDGVPVETVRSITGHKTVEVVLEHYFKPDQEQYYAALVRAMPAVLTGKPEKAKPIDELAGLVGKVSAGTATEADKKRLRLLAAKV